MNDTRFATDGVIPAVSRDSVLLPYQQRWCADASPVKLAEKGRRIGLTWAEAADAALLAARAGGMDCWYIGYNKDMAQEFIRDCATWARHYDLAAGEILETEEVFKDDDEDKAILAYVIRFASGFRITALSSRPSNLRGKQGRVIIDEAAFHDELNELLKAAMALLMWGGQVHILSTHNGADNPFNERVQDVRAGKRPYSLHRITLDDALEDGLYRRICLVREQPYSRSLETAWRAELVAFYGDAADEELFCIPRNSGGKYLSLALIDSRMRDETPVLRFACKPGFETLPDSVRAAEVREWLDLHVAPLLSMLRLPERTAAGWDFGRSGDLSALVPLVIGESLERRPPFVLELRNVPFRQQEQICFYVLDRLPGLSAAAFDARGNGQFLAEVALQRYGSRVHQVMLSERWYGEHLPPLKAALEDGTLTGLPRDADIQADLRAFEVIRGIPRIPDRRSVGRDGLQRHGDVAIALALAHFASRQGAGMIEFKSAGARPSLRRVSERGTQRLGRADLGGF